MTVQELIDKLNEIEDKNADVYVKVLDENEGYHLESVEAILIDLDGDVLIDTEF